MQARILKAVSQTFSQNDLDVGTASGVRHHIELEPRVPFKERTRRVSPADFSDLKKHLKDLLAAGIIEESNSSYASPVVQVRKKNGELRMAVDYRKLNYLTKKDAYPLPRIEETFTLLSGSKWFSVHDLKSGYYQLEVEPSDRPKTAFTTPFRTWQFRRMPQGLTNLPATFQRTMEKVMEGMNLQEVITFLDDLIVFSNTLEEHEERLMKVLKHLSDFGLKLSPSKCKFFQMSCGQPLEDEESEDLDQKISLNRASPCTNVFNILDEKAVGPLFMYHGVSNPSVSQEESVLGSSEVPAVETLLCGEGAVPDDLEDPVLWTGQETIPGMTMEDWRQLQRTDSSIAYIMGVLEGNISKETGNLQQPEVALLLREKPKLLLLNGVLHRKIVDQRSEASYQLVVPSSHRERAFHGVHSETGHMDSAKQSDTVSPVGSPNQKQSRPQRKRLPPSYIRDYQVDSRVGGREHHVKPPLHQTVLYNFQTGLGLIASSE
ncbi:hypothetical protein AOLI_G00267090 [Acnodon oligacanthus]